MADSITFTVLGLPFGKQRPRFNRYTGRTYTPAETVRAEEAIAAAYMRQVGVTAFSDKQPVRLEIKAYTQIPVSGSRKRRELMEQGVIRPTVKPDWDNIGKLISDALNGVAYTDDRYIAEAVVCKYYSKTPRTEITLTKIEEKSSY